MTKPGACRARRGAPRRLSRAPETLQAKLEAQRALRSLEARRNRARRELFESQDRIGQRRDELIAGVERQLQFSNTWNERFVVAWALDPVSDV